MKKIIFILLGFTLCIGTALASDVGKLQTNISPAEMVVQQHVDFVLPAITMVTFETTPVVLVSWEKVVVVNEKLCPLYSPPAYWDSDYGICSQVENTYTQAKQNGYNQPYLPTARHVLV